MTHHQPWTQTHSGRAFPLLNPTPQDVEWRVVAISLSGIPRFLRHTFTPYSVAQHSVLACQVMETAVRDVRGRGALLAAADGPSAKIEVHALMRRAELDDETLRRLKLATLIHDAHEAYMGDIIDPVSAALTILAGADHVSALKNRLDSAIHPAAGLPWPLPSAWVEAIKAADRIMLATERRDLMAEGPDWGIAAAPASFSIRPEPEHRAADVFLERLNGLLGGMA